MLNKQFAKQAEELSKKLEGRNRILRTLAGTTWGKSKDTIATRYKTFGRSIIDYVAPVWTAGLSDTQWRNIQTGQNNALRTATGCHSITPAEHLHLELKILPARYYCSLLTGQFLLKTQTPDHPNHASFSKPRPHGSRNIVLD